MEKINKRVATTIRDTRVEAYLWSLDCGTGVMVVDGSFASKLSKLNSETIMFKMAYTKKPSPLMNGGVLFTGRDGFFWI